MTTYGLKNTTQKNRNRNSYVSKLCLSVSVVLYIYHWISPTSSRRYNFTQITRILTDVCLLQGILASGNLPLSAFKLNPKVFGCPPGGKWKNYTLWEDVRFYELGNL